MSTSGLNSLPKQLPITSTGSLALAENKMVRALCFSLGQKWAGGGGVIKRSFTGVTFTWGDHQGNRQKRWTFTAKWKKLPMVISGPGNRTPKNHVEPRDRVGSLPVGFACFVPPPQGNPQRTPHPPRAPA